MKKEIELEWKKICSYADRWGFGTDIDQVKTDALKIYEDWVCDCRYRPEDVARMVLLIEKERQENV